MYAQIFSIIAPIFLIAALGYGWSFLRLRYDGRFISRIVMDVGAPCLIVASIHKTRLPADDVLQMGLITITGLALLFAGNLLLLRWRGLSLRTYLGPLSFANTGNMGVPICLFAFGEQAMALALVLFMTTSIFHFSIGVALAGSRNALHALLTSPVFYAALLSMLLVVTGWQLPPALFNTIELLGGIAIPLMLFSLGASLQSIRAHAFVRSTVLALWRLLAGFAVGLLLCWLFELDGVLAGVVIIQSSMPSAVFNYLLALSYDRQPGEVAGIVVLSTLLSFASLPLLLWFVLQGV
ncbi:MAG TPA: AEC family transporter [Pseudomonadales bacterium]